jgi:OmpA-OmpF porin, OOP family
MRIISKRTTSPVLLAILILSASGSISAQEQDATDPTITVTGESMPDLASMTPGPEIKGNITARSGDQIQVTTADGSSSVFSVTDATKIKSSKGIFSSKKLASDSLLNGLPITVKTLQWSGGLVASQIKLRNNDLRTASMIRNGTAQGFAEQTAATQALRGRMGDIDNYNIKSTMNVNFDTGKAVLSPQAKADLCSTASSAEQVDNALMLVVGYTDSTGSDEINQVLSEKRAGSVINYLQQACGWKPYRMLTPTGMAEADPMADNTTIEGKAQNRRVAVNILVSKGLDGL